LWSERRRATKTALVSLHGNSYQVDAWLAGKYVELVFDPFDLANVEVRAGGKPAGTAVPFTVGRHRHPKTRTPDGQARTEPAPTGIDYLSALGDGHDEALREQVSYRSLVCGPREEPPKREEKDEEERGEHS
jgi:putative transposase